MTMRQTEGFELHAQAGGAPYNHAGMALKYQNVSLSTLFDSYGAGPISTKALFHAGAALTPTASARWRTPNFASATQWFQGMRLKVVTGGLYLQSLHLLKFIAGNGLVQVTFELFTTSPSSSSYGVKVWSGDPSIGGAVLLGSVTDAIPCDLWSFLEFKVIISSTAGRAEVRLNGSTSPILLLTILNTNPAGTSGAVAAEYKLAAEAGKNIGIDDMYLVDNAGSVNNTFLGDKVVEGLIVTVDGAGANEWLPSAGSNHAAMVDDVGPDDGDSTLLQTSAVEKREFFDVGALALITGNIAAVTINFVGRVSSGAGKNVKPAHRTSTPTDGYGTTIVVDSIAYKHFQAVMEVSPVTAAPFTVDDVTNGEFGLKSVA